MCSAKVLYVPNLAYNLVSVPKATEAGKIVQFDGAGCKFLNHKEEITAFAERRNNLYHLKMKTSEISANVVSKESKGRLWHRLFGHFNSQSMRRLVREELVSILDCDAACEMEFCEACVGGKQCKKNFEPSTTKTSSPLELVHSDVCGKMGAKSRGETEYFLTLLDDKTHYVWVYPLKNEG